MKHSLLLSLLLFAGTTCAFSNTINEIFVSPPESDVTAGQTFDVLIDITDIPNLYAYQFSLSFNPTVLAADSITEGALFANTNDSFFLPGTIDNSGGSIAYTADTLLSGPGPAVNGPGTLAVAEFTAIGTGRSPIDLSNVMLLDSSLNQISVTAALSGRANVAPADVVTVEPATISLIALAFCLMFFGKVRRSKRHATVAKRSKEQVLLKGGAQAFNL